MTTPETSTPTAPATVASEERTTAYENPFIRVDTTPVAFPNGAPGTYSTVTIGTGRGVVIVPTAHGVAGHPGVSFGLLAVHRFPVERTLLEFPRGGIDAGEGQLTAVIREAIEELDPCWGGADYERLGVIHPDSGLLTTEMTVYTAHLPGPPHTGHVEDVTGAVQTWVPAEQMTELIAAGAVTDAMTLAAFTLASCKA